MDCGSSRQMKELLLVLLNAFYLACSLQDEVKFQQAETFVGDDLTIECPHIPRNTSSILVQQSKNVIGHQEVLLHCINFDSQDRRCIQQRLPVKYAYTQSRLSATFAESEFELIGNYSCQYYRDKVFVSQDIVHVDVHQSPTGVELLKETYFVHAGEDMSLSCIATSRPGVNITWSYPAWISVKKVTRNETINRYLTKVNSTVAFKMTSSLHKRNISCHLSYRHDNLVQNSSTYLHVLDPKLKIYVTMFQDNKKLLVKDGDELTLNKDKSHILTCCTVSPTKNQSYPNWEVPRSIKHTIEVQQSKDFEYHRGFRVNIATLTLERQKYEGTHLIKCDSDTQDMEIEIILKSKDSRDAQFYATVSLAVAISIVLVSVTVIKIYRCRTRYSQTTPTIVLKRVTTENDGKASGSFRRSLPPVPGPDTAQQDVARENPYRSIGTYENAKSICLSGDVLNLPKDGIEFSTKLSSSLIVTRWLGKIRYKENGEVISTIISYGEPTAKPQLQILWSNYVRVLLKLSEHRNILKVLGICYGKDTIFTAHHFNENITLRSYLKTHVRSNLLERDRFACLLSAAYDVVCGLEFLASEKCCHPFLCAQRILVDARKTCKLFDFCGEEDASEVLEQLCVEKDHGFTSLPPESVFLGEYNPASDIWSVGVTIWEIFSCGETPYLDICLTDFEKLLRTEERLSKPVNLPDELFTILEDCWKQRCSRRPTISKLIAKLRTVSSNVLKQIQNGPLLIEDLESVQPMNHRQQMNAEIEVQSAICERTNFSSCDEQVTNLDVLPVSTESDNHPRDKNIKVV